MKVDVNKNAKVERVARLLQPPRLAPEETGLLTSVFSDSPDIYLALRDCFFGFELDDSQKQLLGEVKKISPLIRKIFLPEVVKGIPFGNTFDLWQTKDLQTSDPQAGLISIEAKKLIIDFLETSLNRLNNPELTGVHLEIPSALQQLSFIQGRNGYISYIDNQIRFLIQHVNMQTMSKEEITTLMSMNSAK
jgi:hypothetical protein